MLIQSQSGQVHSFEHLLAYYNKYETLPKQEQEHTVEWKILARWVGIT